MSKTKKPETKREKALARARRGGKMAGAINAARAVNMKGLNGSSLDAFLKSTGISERSA